MKKILLILFVLCMILSGCSKKEETVTETDYYTFTDSTGHEVVLEHKPEKVAVLFSSLAQIWSLAGGQTTVTVGDSISRGFVSEDAVLVNETAGLKIDFEALIAADPDFVVVSSDLSAQVEAADLMRGLGVPVAEFKDECFEDYLYILNIMTDITQNKDAYEEHGVKLEESINTLLADFNSKEHKEVSYLFIRAGSGFSSTKAKTADDHFACVMIDELGGKNIVEPGSALTESISVEYMLVSDPDIILIAPQGNVDNAKAYIDELFSSDGYRDVPAIADGRYVFLDKELFNYKPNQNWLKAYETLIDTLYE